MKVRGLVRNDAKDGVKWRGLCHGEQKANSHKSGKNGLKMFVVVVVGVVDKTVEIATSLEQTS